MTENVQIRVDEHPLLFPLAFVTEFAEPIGSLVSPDWLRDLLTLDAPDGPASQDDAIKQAIRAMLRTHGYKPSGRGKPASEYLLRAAEDGALASINLAVDLCNATSLHWQIPISVVDLDRASEPFRIGIPEGGSSYVFNASGQEIRLDGLPCLFDAEGPCANAVRDSQRTKTSDATRRTLSVIWGSRDHAGHTRRTAEWYRDASARAGARTVDVTIDS